MEYARAVKWLLVQFHRNSVFFVEMRVEREWLKGRGYEERTSVVLLAGGMHFYDAKRSFCSWNVFFRAFEIQEFLVDYMGR